MKLSEIEFKLLSKEVQKYADDVAWKVVYKQDYAAFTAYVIEIKDVHTRTIYVCISKI